MTDDYSQTTRDIRVSVRCFFLDDQSRPDEGRFVWGYRIRIDNLGKQAVQLLRRRWEITDARGRVQQVEGTGVVGQQPVIEPGESFEYTSGTPLETPSGFMRGTYSMVQCETEESFDVAIPLFSLDSPYHAGRIH
jgi:ApaG protein